MGCFSRMKTPGKEFGWKQAEHWITTCCEMGYAVEVVFVLFCHFVGLSLEVNILLCLREEGRPNNVLVQGHFIPSVDVVDFVRAVQVVIGNISSPNS